MSEKIYEYKDDQDWYIGKWDGLGGIRHLSYDKNDEQLYAINNIFLKLLAESSDSEDFATFDVIVMKQTSHFRLLDFIAQMINQELGRSIEVIPRKEAFLVVENEQLLALHLPKGGFPLAEFFDQGFEKETLLIATHNEGKTKEFRNLFGQLGYQVENLNDYPDLPEVAETGLTFEENARLKAETISKLTGKMVLADDSGLKVDILGGLPGVWSARFSGPDATDARNNAKLLHELAMVFDRKDRSAQFHTTLVVAAPDKDSLVVEADWPGYIATEPKGEHGFGYDPLFLVGESDQTAAQLTIEEKNSQSHRARAVKKLMEVFPSWQNKR